MNHGQQLALLGILLTTTACTPPTLNALNPNQGPEHTLVQVDGSTFLSTTQWDAGTNTQTSLPGGFLGATIFSVPVNATQGNHPVALTRFNKTSNSLNFTVTEAQPFSAPRVDRISLVYSAYNTDDATPLSAWLYVQAANGDVGSTVLINNVDYPTIAHKALINNLLGVPAEDLNTPIHHWVSYIVPWEGDNGSTIQVSVRNLDGQTSSSKEYTLPSNAETQDSDGDDIPDTWELNGYDADGNGTVDIDLPALGASPYRPDLFVEVDVMQNLTNPPTASTWTLVSGMFQTAPIINPTTDNGIHLTLDTSGSVPFWQTIDLTLVDDPNTGQANFYTLKSANFDNANRGRIYHYGIWANARPSGSSGVSDVNFTTNNGGDDFIVSFDDFSASYQTEKSRAATFVHEFGHNLGQKHGGGDHQTYRPNYSSVMSYSWQLRTGKSNNTRLSKPIYDPFYYQTEGATEVNGALPANYSDAPAYSDGMGRTLNETCLNENLGLYDSHAIDWNSDGDKVDNCTTADVDGNGATTTSIDFSNWSNLVFRGPRTNGTYGD